MTKVIGIDASRAFLDKRTGIEEYSLQVLKQLALELKNERVVLYIKENQKSKIKNQSSIWRTKLTNDDFVLPINWQVKTIRFKRLWTQVGLSLEMMFNPVDVLFVPAHTVPFIHPKNTIVTIHGLEYEFCPEAYSWWARLYMRWSIRKSCKWASKIIAVSENTKNDLIKLYDVPVDKIEVVYEGILDNFEFRSHNFESNQNIKDSNLEIHSKFKIQNSKFILFIGRIEERKNVSIIIEAFEILKEKYKIPHRLFLAGKPGFGYEKIRQKIRDTRYGIRELGYVSDEEKVELLKSAVVFVFPSLYEGFGLPILEAQAVGCPVVTSSISSMPEVSGNSAILVDPNNANNVAGGVYKLISDKQLRDDIIKKGLENTKRFSWIKCGKAISRLIQEEGINTK